MHYEFQAGVPKVMGILNVTPDSFYDGGCYASPEAAVRRAVEIEREGADILDMGAQSTRPGSTPVSPQEELQRLVPVLQALQGQIKIPIAIDTFVPEVAHAALALGARIINDVSGTAAQAMAEAVLRHGAGWVLMHNNGGAGTAARYKDVIADVRAGLEALAAQAMQYGVPQASICLDPGIGFSKSREDDLRLLANIERVKPTGFAFLVGASHKRVIAHAAGEPGTAGSLAAHVIAQWGGADILRTHDIAQARQAVNFTHQARLAVDKSCKSR